MPALHDVRIVDFSRVLAGPYCTMLLGDYGAEVIKIETPGKGDDTRAWGPPWAGGESAYFLSTNRNKRSLALNLKHPEGQEIAHKLIAQADVLIENFKVGTMARFGLDYETLHEKYPALVYCSITGYGQDGPYQERPGYDFVIQAEGGIMSITGEADGQPHKVGVAIADITAGLFATSAILAALHHRDNTGVGQYIDVALLDAQVAWLANVAQNYLVSGKVPARYGNGHPNIVPYQVFETADGYLALGVGNDDQFQRLCQVLEAPEIGADPRFQTNADRVKHRGILVNVLQEIFRLNATTVWVARIQTVKIPVAAIQNVAEVLNDPQVLWRKMVQQVQHPTAGDLQLLGPVVKLSQTPGEIHRPPPLLGEHTREILTALGYSQDEIKTLYEDQVVA